MITPYRNDLPLTWENIGSLIRLLAISGLRCIPCASNMGRWTGGASSPTPANR